MKSNLQDCFARLLKQCATGGGPKMRLGSQAHEWSHTKRSALIKYFCKHLFFFYLNDITEEKKVPRLRNHKASHWRDNRSGSWRNPECVWDTKRRMQDIRAEPDDFNSLSTTLRDTPDTNVWSVKVKDKSRKGRMKTNSRQRKISAHVEIQLPA